MKRFSYSTQRPVETHEPQIPNYPDDQSQNYEQTNRENLTYSSFRKKTIFWYSLAFVTLVLLLITTSLQVSQYKEYGEVLAREAYVISVSINLMEDNLMFKYGVLPEDIGFDGLRSAWIENPCHETSMAYYNALKSALDYFEQGKSPNELLTPLKV